jgi:hypothetical protein
MITLTGWFIIGLWGLLSREKITKLDYFCVWLSLLMYMLIAYSIGAIR